MAEHTNALLATSLFLLVAWGSCDGLAELPPRGWTTRERFQCNTDCINYPRDCISEKLVRRMAEAMAGSGFRSAGYEYVIIDDCWQAMARDKSGQLQPDPKRFPSGMKNIVNYVHSLGLKFGLYVSTENTTANGFPGSQGKMNTDAMTLANWGVDMVTVDSYGTQHTSTLDETYRDFADKFKQTGREILFMCRYPYYQRQHGIKLNYHDINQVCHIYKESDDMKDGWEDLEKTLKYFGESGSAHVNYSQPGSWNYVNPVLVGDYGLSPDQLKMQVALWTVMASPMLVSSDIREKNPLFAELLLNPRVLEIHHDALAVMGRQILVNGQVYLWQKPIQPKGSFAIAIYYVNISGSAKKFSVKLQDIGMTTAAAYNMTEVYKGTNIGIYKPWHTLDCEINPTGVLFINAKALP